MSLDGRVVVAFVFARGGSKGLPGKNIRNFAGKPLIAWSIEKAMEISCIDRVIVSTDCEKIAHIAKTYGAEVPFKRPSQLATDSANEFDAWKHAIHYLETIEKSPIDLFVSLPSTAPLRETKDLEKCFCEYLNHDPDLVITVSPANRHPSFNMIKFDQGGYAQTFHENLGLDYRRQDFDNAFDITTVGYVAKPNFIKRASMLLEGKTRAVIVPKERAIDIDDALDFQFAEYLFHQNKISKN
ncbi:acylneuraminate cytidylyltransferase family protein [Alphaproteobacteria bacterium]|nr:acylneuraminate cytidylyltransferase family protein [Alphaproteobacteria bacterium]